MAELQGFIFKTQSLHLYRSFLRTIKGAPVESQGRQLYATNYSKIFHAFVWSILRTRRPIRQPSYTYTTV